MRLFNYTISIYMSGKKEELEAEKKYPGEFIKPIE